MTQTTFLVLTEHILFIFTLKEWEAGVKEEVMAIMHITELDIALFTAIVTRAVEWETIIRLESLMEVAYALPSAIAA